MPHPVTPVKHTLPHGVGAQTPHTGAKGTALHQTGTAGWPPLWGATANRPGTSATNVLASQSPAEGAWPSLAASQHAAQAATSTATNAAQSQHQAGGYPPAWQGQIADQQQAPAAATRVALASPLTVGQVPAVQADPDGAALLQKVQSAVGNGDLSMEEGTKQLVAFLRQREQSSKGKAGVHTPKPPPGFATAGKQLVQQQLEPTSASQADAPSISASLLPFPAMQPNSFTSPLQASPLVTSAQPAIGTEAAGTANPSQWTANSAAPTYQPWGFAQAADTDTSSSQPSVNSTTTTAAVSSLPGTSGMFPVDLVAASAALYAAPATGRPDL